MPRPQPLVALHGAVNFDKLVPFDSAPNAPPLAANDILVMRKAAGGDNLTLSIGDITATGSVNIANLIGGNNNDMLFKSGGVWIGSGPSGLSYDGANMILSGANLNLTTGFGAFFFDGGGITVNQAGGIEVAGTGNIEQTGTGAILANGGGDIAVSGGGDITAANPGRFLAPMGTVAAPAYSFGLDPDTGIFNQGGNRFAWSLDGVEIFRWDDENITGRFVSPSWLLNNEDSPSATTPVFSFTNDGNTGIGLQATDNLSIIAGGVEIARAKEAVNDSSFLVTQGDANTPGLGFLNDDDTGFANIGVNQITAINAGTRTWHFTTAEFFSQFSNGPALENAAAGIAQVNIRPDRSTPLTGISAGGSGEMGLRENGVLVATIGPSSALVLHGAGGLTTTGGGGSGPIVKNEGASATNPVFCPNQADPDTGFTRSGVNQSSIVNGGVEALRVRPTTSFRAASSNIIFWDYDDAALKQLEFGADDSGGVGFKMCRVVN